MLNAIPLHHWYWRLADRAARLLPRKASACIEPLSELDGATLRDLGVDRSEIESIEAESHGAASLTRRRVRAGHWIA
jgi:hypothetical protein